MEMLGIAYAKRSLKGAIERHLAPAKRYRPFGVIPCGMLLRASPQRLGLREQER
jgi:hypothetical protein